MDFIFLYNINVGYVMYIYYITDMMMYIIFICEDKRMDTEYD